MKKHRIATIGSDHISYNILHIYYIKAINKYILEKIKDIETHEYI